MVKTIKFVNLLILFIFTFLATDANANGKPYPYLFELSCLSYIQNIPSLTLIFVSYFLYYRNHEVRGKFRL